MTKFNVNNLKTFIKKATLNFSIESVQLKVDSETVVSNMISEHRDAVTDLKVPNDIFKVKSEYELNFNQPSKSLMPFLNLLDEDEAEIDFKSEKVVIVSGNQKANIHFCSPEIVSVFSGNLKSDLEYFIDLSIDDEFMDMFSKVKKIGTQFGNIYFNVENEVFSIETSDRSNRFSNSLKFDLTEAKNVKDLSLKFDFKGFANMMSLIDNDDFRIKFSCVEVDDLSRGMLMMYNSEETEKYFIMSRRMDNEI